MTARKTDAEIVAERAKVYGDVHENHANVALAWTGVLRARYGHHMPQLTAQDAELLLAAFKVVRASRPVPADPAALISHLDSYPDGRNYFTFAEQQAQAPESPCGVRGCALHAPPSAELGPGHRVVEFGGVL